VESFRPDQFTTDKTGEVFLGQILRRIVDLHIINSAYYLALPNKPFSFIAIVELMGRGTNRMEEQMCPGNQLIPNERRLNVRRSTDLWAI
jgi:hypothetical protein